MKLLQDFKKFVLKGNVLDMAVGIILGAAFGTVVKSVVDDIIMPPIGFLLGGVDFSNIFFTIKDGVTPGPYFSVVAAKAAGAVSINAGMFLNNVISFLIVSLAVFLLVRSVNQLRDVLDIAEDDSGKKKCPFCFSEIDVKATRCPNCTSMLPETETAAAEAVTDTV